MVSRRQKCSDDITYEPYELLLTDQTLSLDLGASQLATYPLYRAIALTGPREMVWLSVHYSYLLHRYHSQCVSYEGLLYIKPDLIDIEALVYEHRQAFCADSNVLACTVYTVNFTPYSDSAFSPSFSLSLSSRSLICSWFSPEFPPQQARQEDQQVHV